MGAWGSCGAGAGASLRQGVSRDAPFLEVKMRARIPISMPMSADVRLARGQVRSRRRRRPAGGRRGAGRGAVQPVALAGAVREFAPAGARLWRPGQLWALGPIPVPLPLLPEPAASGSPAPMRPSRPPARSGKDALQTSVGHMISGAGAGTLTAVLCAPLDVIRTRMQCRGEDGWRARCEGRPASLALASPESLPPRMESCSQACSRRRFGPSTRRRGGRSPRC